MDWTYWGKPLPGFGDPAARLLILGLAPAAHGGNRTGRMFTGDGSARFLMAELYKFGFANQPSSTSMGDGLRLEDAYMTAVVRCAPPKNKPLPEEIENCRPYLLRELELLEDLKIIVPLGQIAFAQTLKSLRRKGFEVPPLAFGHGKLYRLPTDQILVSTYHPSQQNTQTGKLTHRMFDHIFGLVGRNL